MIGLPFVGRQKRVDARAVVLRSLVQLKVREVLEIGVVASPGQSAEVDLPVGQISQFGEIIQLTLHPLWDLIDHHT